MLGCKPKVTPLELNVKLEAEGGKEVDREQYLRLAGKLIYLMAHQARSCLCSSVSQFMQSPKEKHLDAVFKIFMYLKSTPGRGFSKRRSQDDRSIQRC